MPLLTEHGFEVYNFGQPIIIKNNPWIGRRLRQLDVKDSPAALLVKFAPDFIVIAPTRCNTLFLLDTKASITPVFFQAHIDRIRVHFGRDQNLRREDIGEIEREAWYTYNRFFPRNRVALVIATPYNPKLLLADWVDRVTCMWCFMGIEDDEPRPFPCSKCPIFGEEGGTFGVIENFLAGGSGTPHTNIHLSRMRSLDIFLADEFKTKVSNSSYSNVIEDIKTWPLNKPRARVNWTQFNNVITDLRKSCPWLRTRTP